MKMHYSFLHTFSILKYIFTFLLHIYTFVSVHLCLFVFYNLLYLNFGVYYYKYYLLSYNMFSYENERNANYYIFSYYNQILLIKLYSIRKLNISKLMFCVQWCHNLYI